MKRILRGSRGVFFWSLLVCLGELVGCGGDGGEVSGSISGTVTCDGGPLTVGSVLFVNRDYGIGVEGPLDASGNFHIPAIRTGEYQVAIQPPPLPSPEAMEKGEKAAPSPVAPKYRSPETSGLTAQVKEGDNTIDFRL
jgi:hypothetical protein